MFNFLRPRCWLRPESVGTVGFILLLSGAGCTARSGPDEVRFVVADDAGGESIELRNLQFFVHDVALLGSDGVAYPFHPAVIDPWQTEQVVLIDLAGAPGSQRNAVIRGDTMERPAEGFVGIRFVVGVPFEFNHANPLMAAPPLNRTDLFWAWQSGYKFLRVDLNEAARDGSFHLGSTGCVSASALRPPTEDCAEPNRMTVELRGIDPLHDDVTFRLNELVQAMRSANYAACTGNYTENPACTESFRLTGLTSTSGGQRLFGPGP